MLNEVDTGYVPSFSVYQWIYMEADRCPISNIIPKCDIKSLLKTLGFSNSEMYVHFILNGYIQVLKLTF